MLSEAVDDVGISKLLPVDFRVENERVGPLIMNPVSHLTVKAQAHGLTAVTTLGFDESIQTLIS